MRLEIGVTYKLARADPCAIDHEVEFCIDIFELFEADVRMDFAASLAKARGEVIEINRSVHQRDAQRETTFEAVATALCAVPNGPQAHCYRRKRLRAKWNGPFWNFNFTGAQKLPRFDDRDTALGKASEIEEHLVGFERQWDHSFGRLDMVGKPNRRSHAGGCLLPDVLREDRSAVTALDKNDTTRKARHTRADNCDVSIHSLNGRDGSPSRPQIFTSGRLAMASRATARTRVTRPTMTSARSVGRAVLCTPFSLAATVESGPYSLVRAKFAARV